MKFTTFQDMYNQEITVQFSGSGDYRIYLKRPDDDPNKPTCILMNKHQAKILINAIADLMDAEDD
jgi:hypothetical protein